MKHSLLVLSLFASLAAKAQPTVDQFAVHCSGQVQITNAFYPHYSAGEPPHGRFPGIMPSAGFTAMAHFASNDPGCRALEAKYHLGLFTKPLEVFVSVAPVDLATSEAAAQSSIGKVVPVHFKQDVYHALENELPLYPLIFEEALWIQSDSVLKITKYFEVDSLLAHGIPSVEQMSDAQKIALAKKIVDVDLNQVKKPGWGVPYTSLLQSLKPNAATAKVEYLQTLVSLFEGLNPNRTGGIAFFEFNVGGSDGVGLAKVIIELINATGAYDGSKVESLAYQFPGLLLLGTPIGPNVRTGCLPLSPSGFMNVLSQWESATQLNYQQKTTALEVTGTLSGLAPAIAWCLDTAKADPAIRAKAATVYSQLAK